MTSKLTLIEQRDSARAEVKRLTEALDEQEARAQTAHERFEKADLEIDTLRAEVERLTSQLAGLKCQAEHDEQSSDGERLWQPEVPFPIQQVLGEFDDSSPPSQPDPQPWPGEVCKRCGRRNVTGFRVPDDAWAKVVGRETVWCPQCFDEEAQRKGVRYEFTGIWPVSWSDWSETPPAQPEPGGEECPKCGGSGEVYSDSSLYDSRDCPTCNGTGKRAAVADPKPADEPGCPRGWYCPHLPPEQNPKFDEEDAFLSGQWKPKAKPADERLRDALRTVLPVAELRLRLWENGPDDDYKQMPEYLKESRAVERARAALAAAEGKGE
jgi:hypothetical protein